MYSTENGEMVDEKEKATKVRGQLLKAADVFLKTLDGLINRFNSFKKKHIIRRHKKKLPHNSCRKHR